MGSKLSRKSFIKSGLVLGGGLALGIGLNSCKGTKAIPGKLLGAASKTGHKLREGKFASPTLFEEYETVIVGAGITGLSAARYFSLNGYTNYILLDLEEEAGGNSRAGQNKVSAYPWGAHYLPIPGLEHKEIIDFLKDAGCITAFTDTGLPVYNELYLCHAPEERLFINGVWQNGLIPQLGNTPKDNEEIDRFHKLMEDFKNATNTNGKPLFALPVNDSALTDETIALDKISFTDYLTQQGFTSEKLRWYINYCCRDDYGTEAKDTSAFAGIHYFAGRRGMAANAENGDVLTWPEGNAFLANKLKLHSAKNTRNNTLVYHVEHTASGCTVLYWDAKKDKTISIKAKKVLMAGPQFINQRVVKNSRDINYKAFSYAPWVVAAITLKEAPADRTDNRPLSWDNVLYNSSSLGYINNTHQSMAMHQGKTVLSYYKPLSGDSPSAMRKKAYETSLEVFQQEIIGDLKKAHPGIEDSIENLDVWLWGHAMARPTVGFITGSDRKKALLPINNSIYFAHSDLGMPVFEEAFYQGYRAAANLLSSISQ